MNPSIYGIPVFPAQITLQGRSASEAWQKRRLVHSPSGTFHHDAIPVSRFNIIYFCLQAEDTILVRALEVRIYSSGCVVHGKHERTKEKKVELPS